MSWEETQVSVQLYSSGKDGIPALFEKKRLALLVCGIRLKREKEAMRQKL